MTKCYLLSSASSLFLQRRPPFHIYTLNAHALSPLGSLEPEVSIFPD